jgi:hypothetical protein
MHYVPMKMKDPEGPTNEKATPTKILHERNCEHEMTVCSDCVVSWMWDYHVYFRRTAGGRRLAKRAVARGLIRHDLMVGGEYTTTESGDRHQREQGALS